MCSCASCCVVSELLCSCVSFFVSVVSEVSVGVRGWCGEFVFVCSCVWSECVRVLV